MRPVPLGGLVAQEGGGTLNEILSKLKIYVILTTSHQPVRL
jgi:hypothetical protein